MLGYVCDKYFRIERNVASSTDNGRDVHVYSIGMTTRSLGAAVVGTVVLGSRPARAHVDYVTDGPGAALGALEFAATVLSNPVSAGLLAVSGLPPLKTFFDRRTERYRQYVPTISLRQRCSACPTTLSWPTSRCSAWPPPCSSWVRDRSHSTTALADPPPTTPPRSSQATDHRRYPAWTVGGWSAETDRSYT